MLFYRSFSIFLMKVTPLPLLCLFSLPLPASLKSLDPQTSRSCFSYGKDLSIVSSLVFKVAHVSYNDSYAFCSPTAFKKIREFHTFHCFLQPCPSHRVAHINNQQLQKEKENKDKRKIITALPRNQVTDSQNPVLRSYAQFLIIQIPWALSSCLYNL